MRTNQFIIVVVALAMGGGAAFLARSWLQLQTNALAVYQPAGQVVVAAEPLAYGAMVMSESVVGIPWYANTLPEGAFASKDDLHQGGRRTVLYPLKRGEPVLRSRVTGAGQRASLAALLEDGKRAVTVRVDDVRGVAGFVLPGDFVDLVMIADEPSSKRQSYRPAQNVRKGYVLANSDDGVNACTARRGANWPIGSPPDQVTGLPLDTPGPISVAWVKEIGTLIPIGKSTTATPRPVEFRWIGRQFQCPQPISCLPLRDRPWACRRCLPRRRIWGWQR